MPATDTTDGLTEGLLNEQTAPGVVAELLDLIGDGPFTVVTLHESELGPHVMRLGSVGSSSADAGGAAIWVGQPSGVGLFMPRPFYEYERITYRFADGRLQITSVQNGTTQIWVVMPLRAPKDARGLPVGERAPARATGPMAKNEVHGGNVDFYGDRLWRALVGHQVMYRSHVGRVPTRKSQRIKVLGVWISSDTRLYIEYEDEHGNVGCHMLRLRKKPVPSAPYGAILEIVDTGAYHFETLDPADTHYVYLPLP